MNDLVYRGPDGQGLTDSLRVAMKFEKEHRDVLKSIRNLLMTAQNSAVLSMFVETTYLNEQNKEQPMFIMNEDGFALLAMGFTGQKAITFKLDFIEEFRAMRNQLKATLPQDYPSALRALADSEEKKQKALKQLEEKAQQLDESKEWYTVKRYAKENQLDWRTVNWKKLKAISHEHGYEIKRVFDANYSQVNSYHIDVFNIVYNKPKTLL